MQRITDYDYTGPSMKRVFKPADGLIIDQNTDFNALKPGDIINFKPPGNIHHIVHRIIKKTAEGYITRGDNNSGPDPYIITPEFNPSLVVAIRRGKKDIKLYRGKIGVMIHHKNLMLKKLQVYTKSPLKRILDRISDAGIFYKLHLYDNKIEVKQYRNNNFSQKILFLGKKQIGRKIQSEEWNIRQPWRLFIDPKILDEANQK